MLKNSILKQFFEQNKLSNKLQKKCKKIKNNIKKY